MLERLFADGYADLVSAASCLGTGSPPPPPRCTTSPPALVGSHGHGGGDLRDSLRQVFEWLVANGYVESVAPGVRASSPPPPLRYAAPLLTLVASGGHGGGEPRDEWLVADGCVDVASAVTRVGARAPTHLLPWDAPQRAFVASDGHGGRDPLRKLFERIVADGYLYLASPASGSAFRHCTIYIGRFPSQKVFFHQQHPRIQELDVAHEEVDDLTDALALFITKPKLFAQLSLMLSDTEVKSQKAYVCATIDVNSAFRDFDGATNAQLIGSCTSAPDFCFDTGYMPRGSQFLHHEHATRTDRWMPREVLACRQCETSAKTIQYLLHLNSILEQKLAVENTKISGDDTGPPKPELVVNVTRNSKEAKSFREKSTNKTSGGNAPEPDPAPNSNTESAGDFQEDKFMEKFNKILVDCVFFALPQVLIFSPKYQAPVEKKTEERLSLMALIQHTDNESYEKAAVVFFFVVFVSVWLLALVLSQFGCGRRCTAVVSVLTLLTVGSTVAFIDYMLSKCLPGTALSTGLFWGHFVAMFVGIAYIWFTHVPVPKFPSVQLPSCQGVFDRLRGLRQNPAPVLHDAKEEDELKQVLLPV